MSAIFCSKIILVFAGKSTSQKTEGEREREEEGERERGGKRERERERERNGWKCVSHSTDTAVADPPLWM